MKWRQVTLEETMKYPAVQATIHYHEDKIVWLVPILPDESASLPSLPVTGESEAIGERKFTLDEVHRLLKIAYTDASGIYKDVPCGEWWPEFKLQNNL